jgi:pimeloyl-ACP methyl ester carboxylesterase
MGNNSAAPRLVKLRCDGHDAGIVLIHGFGGRADQTWGDLPEILVAEPALREWDVVSLGYETDLVASLLGFWKRGFWSRQPSLQSLADGLRTRFGDVEPLASYRDVVFVAHSMGGLVLQRALLDGEPLRKKTRRVFLFGTPSGGLTLAGRGRWVNQQVRDMAAGGEFIRGLRAGWEELRPRRTFEFLAVKGDQDYFVPPESSQGPFPYLDGLRFLPEECETVAGDHVDMVKPINREDETPQLLISRIQGEAAPTGIWSPAWVARGEGEARETIESYGEDPAALDTQARISLAVAYETVGDREQAVSVLTRGVAGSADAMGTLAGRYKRAWQEGRRQSDAEQALTLYRKGFETASQNDQPRDAYYTGINLAYMKLAVEDDLDGARETAREVLGWVEKSTRPDAPWKAATEGEALAYLGETERALARYREALASEPRPEAWKIASMYRQARSVGHLLQSTAFTGGIETLFRG